MATHNWTYAPSVPNKYGFVIPAGANNVRPTGYCYISLSGDDIQGNGSRDLPYRTLAKVVATFAGGSSIRAIISSGVWREYFTTNTNGISFVGDGDVTFDITAIFNSFMPLYNSMFYNIKFRGSGAVSQAPFFNNMYDCTLDGMSTSPNNIAHNSLSSTGTIIRNANLYWTDNASAFPTYRKANITLDKCNVIINVASGANAYLYQSIIFNQCNVWFVSYPDFIDYSIFYQCNFRFLPYTSITPPTAFYPSVPSGYTYIDNLTSFKAAVLAQFGNDNVCNYCTFADPKFNDRAIGDYTLQFDSPAKNRSYQGTYAGAKSIAYSLQASTDPALSGFDPDTVVNLNVADDSITFIDSNEVGSIETVCVPNIIGREIKSLPAFGFNADRNGQYVDSILDLSGTTIAAGDPLTANTPYLVETASITYNGQPYTAGQRFTTLSTPLVFTTTAGGVLREILEAPQRHTVQMRCGNGGTIIPLGDNLVIDNWYYVSGSITYDGDTITDKAFKAHVAEAFTGTGVVELALDDTMDYQHYEIGEQPYSNNVGNVRDGEIIRGSGDPAFVRGAINSIEFPINQKYLQLKYTFQVANLRP